MLEPGGENAGVRHGARRTQVLTCPVTCYPMSGTELGYAVTRCAGTRDQARNTSDALVRNHTRTTAAAQLRSNTKGTDRALGGRGKKFRYPWSLTRRIG
eukprot:1254993-Rhodomonas_salina.1